MSEGQVEFARNSATLYLPMRAEILGVFEHSLLGSPDASEVYRFDPLGRHLETRTVANV